MRGLAQSAAGMVGRMVSPPYVLVDLIHRLIDVQVFVLVTVGMAKYSPPVSMIMFVLVLVLVFMLV